MFSDIVQRFDVPLNALYQERDARRARGLPVIDLVSGNVNRAGFIFPQALLKQAFLKGIDRAQTYDPHPLGQRAAREVVARFYKKAGVRIPSGHILITPGTSLSYEYLFRLLANPGDEILCPRPSYPLLDSIAELCHVRLTKYRLLEKKRWEIDFEHLKSQITSKTRAVLLISPHNPTGAVATPDEINQMSEIAARRNLPIISDEVFSAFLFQSRQLPRPTGGAAPLVFTLNGVSKMWALPSLKLGWIAVTGDSGRVKTAMRALDQISDAFLPVNEAAQFALPYIFAKGQPFLKVFQDGVRQRMAATVMALGVTTGLSFVPPEGGFYLTVRLGDAVDEEKSAVALLRQDHLLVHPGYFYDLEGSHWVLSFLTPLSHLKAALRKISRHFDA